MLADRIKTHLWALLLSVAVGGIYASHHFFIQKFFLNSGHDVYAPITTAEYYDEALLYGPRAHNAFLNFGTRGDFSLAEYPRSPAFLPLLNPLLLGGLGKMFGSMNAGIMASDFVFPALIFLVLYFIVYEVGIGLYGSLLFAAVFIMSPMVGIAVPPLSSAHVGILKQAALPFLPQNEALYFSHFDEPKITFLFLIFFIYALTRALKRQNRTSIAMAGIGLGLLFYTYLYDWATMVTALGILGCWFLATKDYRRFKIIAVIAGIGILVSSYYWINLLMLNNVPQSHDIIARLGGEFSHQLRLATVWKSYVRAIVLVLLLWIFVKNRAKEITLVAASILVSYMVVVNEQVITGFNVQPDHWYRVQLLPIALSVTLLIARIFKKWQESVMSNGSLRKEAMFRVAGTGIIAYLFISSLAGQYAYARDHTAHFAVPLSYVEGLRWLDTHTDSGSVVGTLSPKGNLDVQLHTHNKIFFPFGLSTIAPEEELWQRLMIMSVLWDVRTDQFITMLKERGWINYLFGDQYGTHKFDANFTGYWWQIPDEQIAVRAKAYNTLRGAKRPLARVYRLDYLLVDKQEFPSWQEPRVLLPAREKVFENDRIMIFAIHFSPPSIGGVRGGRSEASPLPLLTSPMLGEE